MRRGRKHNLTRAEFLSGGTARLYAKRGEALSHAKLTAAAVAEIRASNEQTTRLAERFGVHPNTIYRARARRNWAHVRE